MVELKPLALKHVTHRLNSWVAMSDGSFRSGNVVIRNDGGSGIRSDWRIYCVDGVGRLVRVHPRSRPWGYGHAGQAKVGAAHIVKPQTDLDDFINSGVGI